MANLTTYGFYTLESVFASRIAEVGVDRVFDAVFASTAEYNRVRNAALSLLAERSTVAKERFEVPSSGTLQPLDQYGNPLPVRVAEYYDVAYPIYGAGTAWGGDRVIRNLLTVQEAQRITADALQRDANWMTKRIMAALLNNTSYTFSDLIGPDGSAGLGDITVKPLANGDTDKYVKRGAQASATDDHYLAQAADIDDTHNPFSTIRSELVEHVSNGGGPLIAFCAPNLIEDITALSTFVERRDNDLQLATSVDQMQTDPSRFIGFGDEVHGKIKNGVWIVESSAVPSSYILTIATGAGAPLVMREYAAPELQGLFPERHVNKGNVVDNWIRYAGFGVRRRTAAVAYYIGSGSYAVPSGYTEPVVG